MDILSTILAISKKNGGGGSFFYVTAAVEITGLLLEKGSQ